MVACEICQITVDMKQTGRNILRLRKEKKVTVNVIREAMGFQSNRSVYKWQKGETIPTVDNLVRLGLLFRVSIDEILVITSQKSDPQGHCAKEQETDMLKPSGDG